MSHPGPPPGYQPPGQQPYAYRPPGYPLPGQQPYGHRPPGYPPPAPPPPVPGLGDLSRPLYDATIGQAVGRFWRKYVVFSGRASRSEYWWWYLVATIVSSVLSSLNLAIVGLHVTPYSPGADFREFYLDALRSSLKTSVAAYAWSLVTAVGQLAVSVRRLHDTGRSGWWYLLILIPVVGLIILIVFLAEAPRPEGQRYDR